MLAVKYTMIIFATNVVALAFTFHLVVTLIFKANFKN